MDHCYEDKHQSLLFLSYAFSNHKCHKNLYTSYVEGAQPCLLLVRFSTKSFVRYTLTLFSCLSVMVCNPRILLITSTHEYSPSCNWRCRWDLNPGSDSRRTKRLATAPLQPYLGTAPRLVSSLLHNTNNICKTSPIASLYPST